MRENACDAFWPRRRRRLAIIICDLRAQAKADQTRAKQTKLAILRRRHSKAGPSGALFCATREAGEQKQGEMGRGRGDHHLRQFGGANFRSLPFRCGKFMNGLSDCSRRRLAHFQAA